MNQAVSLSSSRNSLSTTLISTQLSQQSIANENARRNRHQKVFAQAATLLSFSSSTRNFFEKTFSGRKSVRSVLSPYLHFKTNEGSKLSSPSHTLFKRYSAVVALFFLLGSFSPLQASTDGSSYGDLEGSLDSQALSNPYSADENGSIAKLNPQTSSDVGDRSTMNDYLLHTVVSGETVSTIANSYGLHANTVLWANGIANANQLKVGQELAIPPVDGIGHTVVKGEDLGKIAKIYNVSPEAITKQNNLAKDQLLALNENIFIPGAKPIAVDVPVTPLNFSSTNLKTTTGRDTPARVASTSRVASVAPAATGGSILQPTNVTPVGAKPFIFPTRGTITQKYQPGHYALDIGNRDKPAIWAAGAGTVIKANEGCADVSYTCGGGYGNYIIIDHGNGLQTLYGHMTYLEVKLGQHVNQGDVIGKMGRSGNVHGVTGIHLHFEVRRGKDKLPPGNFY